jgi:nucleotide-binding universal stress UspA family protein
MPEFAGILQTEEERHNGDQAMYRKILIATDGSSISRKAVKEGIALAKQIGAKVVGFYSPEDYRIMFYSEFVPPMVITEEEFQEQSRKTAVKRLGFIEKSAQAAGVPYEGYYVASIVPWQAIIDVAKKKRCNLIVMGSHGRSGLAGVVLGSQTTKVLTHSKIPVLVTR